MYEDEDVVNRGFFNVWAWFHVPDDAHTIRTIEIINNTRGGIVIFSSENKRERGDWGANSSSGYRAKR